MGAGADPVEAVAQPLGAGRGRLAPHQRLQRAQRRTRLQPRRPAAPAGPGSARRSCGSPLCRVSSTARAAVVGARPDRIRSVASRTPAGPNRSSSSCSTAASHRPAPRGRLVGDGRAGRPLAGPGHRRGRHRRQVGTAGPRQPAQRLVLGVGQVAAAGGEQPGHRHHDRAAPAHLGPGGPLRGRPLGQLHALAGRARSRRARRPGPAPRRSARTGAAPAPPGSRHSARWCRSSRIEASADGRPGRPRGPGSSGCWPWNRRRRCRSAGPPASPAGLDPLGLQSGPQRLDQGRLPAPGGPPTATRSGSSTRSASSRSAAARGAAVVQLARRPQGVPHLVQQRHGCCSSAPAAPGR